MSSPRRFGLLRCAVAVAVALAACDSPDTPSAPAEAGVSRVEILSTGLQLEPGFSAALTAIARRTDGEPLPRHGGTWASSNPAVATVSADGLVSAIALGEAFVVLARGALRDSILVQVVSALPRDVWIQHAHITQATQAASALNYVPMIEGRAAVVNATVWCSSTCRQPVDVALRIYGADGTTLRHADTITVTSGFDAPDLVKPSAQFLVPADVLVGNLFFWRLEVDPRKTVVGNVIENDQFPAAEPQRQFVVRVPPLKIKFIPLHLSSYPDGLATVNDADVERYLRMVRSTFPVSTILASVGPTVTIAQPYTPGSTVPYMQELLRELDAARLADEKDLETYWMGIVKRPAELRTLIVGGIAFRPAAGQLTGARTRTAISPMAGTESIDPLGAITVAHELGHSFGRPHSPCGATDGLPTFPYQFGFIGAVGHDVQAWVEGRASEAVGYAPSATADLMGYCSPSWISDFTFRGILLFRGVQ